MWFHILKGRVPTSVRESFGKKRSGHAVNYLMCCFETSKLVPELDTLSFFNIGACSVPTL